MNELDTTIRMLNKLMDWQPNTCHFFYVTEGVKNLPNEDLKESFDYFIGQNYDNAKFKKIDEIKNDFKNLSYDDKVNYFSKEDIYVVDCSNIDKDNIYIFNSIYDLTKNEKTAFIYYTSPDKLRDYLMLSEQYQFRASSIENIDEYLHKFHSYKELKNEIDLTNPSNTSTKKIKM